jgi:hypothetical protein
VTVCAAGAGLAVAIAHALLGSVPGTERWHTLFAGTVTALGLAAGQGAVAMATAGLLLRRRRTLRFTFLLGLVIGAFDLAAYLLQMLVPATDLGWGRELVLLLAAAAAVTLLGAQRPTASAA